MRRMSRKRLDKIRETEDARLDFALEFGRCWLCDKPATDTHEIACGSFRNAALSERCCWIRTCRTCHDQKLGDRSLYPIARQLALKLLKDPEHYDRIRVNNIRGRQPDAITSDEVYSWKGRET